jgi:hypothetical protein
MKIGFPRKGAVGERNRIVRECSKVRFSADTFADGMTPKTSKTPVNTVFLVEARVGIGV